MAWNDEALTASLFDSENIPEDLIIDYPQSRLTDWTETRGVPIINPLTDGSTFALFVRAIPNFKLRID